jgi:excisionase family DNA binding protein
LTNKYRIVYNKSMLLSIAEVAKRLSVHPETLRRWDRQGILKAVRINDRGDRRYSEESIEAFVKTKQS